MKKIKNSVIHNKSLSKQQSYSNHMRLGIAKTPIPSSSIKHKEHNKSTEQLPLIDKDQYSSSNINANRANIPNSNYNSNTTTMPYSPVPSPFPFPNYPQIPYQAQQPGQSSSPNLDFTKEDAAENIKVVLRIRPLNLLEQGRQDEKCLELLNTTRLVFTNKNIMRNYNLNLIFSESSTQEDVFFNCSLNKLLDNALNGYSVTIFAYGQTGSGKTYTIMGREDSINEKVLANDQYSGIMPKCVKYIWTTVCNRKEKFYIKVSFLEIYNEQINDLLNPTNTNLQIRWDQQQGFFVEGLIVIECKTPADIVEVILQGTKNRKTGSHELNKDSSRSHSILTIYIISEYEGVKRYGKVSFVDLAGSERLKETKSSGGMLKETGNINRSLMVLGKVIASLTEKKSTTANAQQQQHIPYRDSKLTMLLMDSIGGSAKTLMIACVSPSVEYADETMSTLNYATRTMNIQNKPTVQMDKKDQNIISLKTNNDSYKLENDFLKNEFIKLIGSIPSIDKGGFTQEEITAFKSNGKISDLELQVLQDDLAELKRLKELNEAKITNLRNENMILNAKLKNLEAVFIGGELIRNQDGTVTNEMGDNYNMSSIMLENQELKKALDKVEVDKLELKEILTKKENIGNSIINENSEYGRLKEHNVKLTRRVEFLQKRERELLETIMRLKMDASSIRK